MPDYLFMLDSRLSAEQRAVLNRMQELAVALEMNVYLAGGAVRDLVSGMPIRDLDFTVEGNPSRFARELEKPNASGPGTSAAHIVEEDERRRHVELVFPGEVDASISASHDEVYDHPGAKPEIHWSPIMNDLRRRDFSMNAVAISLNAGSRGLLLDPTNGLADLERREIRAMTNHSFTNQPVRLLRVIRFCERLGFKMDPRTQEWYERAIERGLHETLQGEYVGREIVQLAREEKPSAILKAWEEEELLGAAHPQLARRHPDYEGITRTMRVRDSLIAAGYPSGRVYRALVVPLTYQILGRLKQRERTAAMSRMELRSKLADAIQSIENDAAKSVKTLMGKKTAANRDAFDFLESLPLEQLIFIQTEFSKPRALGKIKNYLQKWRPLRRDLPIEELEKLGIPRGPKFDKILEQLFNVQLGGRGRAPEDRTRLLRSFAGLKPEPKKKKEKEEIPLLKGKKDAGKDATKEAAPEKGKLTKTPIPPPPQSKIVRAMSKPERPKRPAVKSRKPAKKKKKR